MQLGGHLPSMHQLEAINRWCGSSSPPFHPIDLLFLSSKFQLRETENLTAGNTECTSVFYVNSPVTSSQMKAIGITFF